MSARTNLEAVSIVPGPPSPGVAQQHSWIALLEVEGSEEWNMLGRMTVEETYNQKVYISVLTRDGEGTSQPGRDIAYGLRAEISAGLRDDPTLGGVVWQCQIDKDCQYFPRLGIEQPGPAGGNVIDMTWRESALYFTILVTNRLTRT